jgi:hypothetical protein
MVVGRAFALALWYRDGGWHVVVAAAAAIALIDRQIDSDSETEIRQKSPSPAKQQNKTPTVRLISPVKSQNHTTSEWEREW